MRGLVWLVVRFIIGHTKKSAVVKACYAEPIKQLIEAEPSFGYRTVAALLGMNKNTVQRVFQLKGWQVRKRSVGRRPCIQAVPSKAQEPKQRWSTDLCRVWGGQDGWLSLALVMDCHTRELLGWQLSKTGKSEPTRVFRRQFILSHATLADSSNWR